MLEQPPPGFGGLPLRPLRRRRDGARAVSRSGARGFERSRRPGVAWETGAPSANLSRVLCHSLVHTLL